MDFSPILKIRADSLIEYPLIWNNIWNTIHVVFQASLWIFDDTKGFLTAKKMNCGNIEIITRETSRGAEPGIEGPGGQDDGGGHGP